MRSHTGVYIFKKQMFRVHMASHVKRCIVDPSQIQIQTTLVS